MKMVALLRGINVGGNRKVSMPALCASAAAAGLVDVRSYINSGNLVFEAGRMKPDKVVVLVEQIIEDRFGFHVDVIVRSVTQWSRYAAGSPFPEAAAARPNLLMLGLSCLPCGGDTEDRLCERALFGERISVTGDAIWVDFATSAGNSKLTPAWLDKSAGSPVTLRNWNTVRKLHEMLTGL